MATDSGILACKNPMERGAWQAMVCGITELDITERLDITHTRKNTYMYIQNNSFSRSKDYYWIFLSTVEAIFQQPDILKFFEIISTLMDATIKI